MENAWFYSNLWGKSVIGSPYDYKIRLSWISGGQITFQVDYPTQFLTRQKK